MLKPTNHHIQVEPLKSESFIATTKDSYEEIGVVLAVDEVFKYPFSVGDRVYFDSFRCAKYPNGPDKFYWLVEFENIRAYEKVPELGV